MPMIPIAFGVLVAAFAGGLWLARRGGGKLERRRAKAITDATTRRHEVLPERDLEHVAEIHAIVEEYRTGELPKYREPRRPSVLDVARKYGRRPRHAARRVPKSRRFDPLTSPMPVTERPVMLPARQPEPWQFDSFTTSWTKAEIAGIVARAKAKAAS